MSLSRQQRHHQAACARYNAGKNKPLERRRVQSFLSPITRAFNQIATLLEVAEYLDRNLVSSREYAEAIRQMAKEKQNATD